ncbi:ATP-binding protein [Clostridium thailandense]|uniref:ATP-binding protein n=1 Tax=Clostridium thailandense TaxID=2794346 RepID=UPI0039897B8E
MKETLFKKNLYIIILMVVIVPLAGELKFYPFPNTFRVTFGVPIFFLLLLAIRKVPLVLCGAIVGASVVCFRLALSISTEGFFQLQDSFILHFPTFFYYLTYSYVFYLAKLNRFHHHPLIVGFLSAIIEITSSIVELSIRHYVLKDIITFSILNEVVIIAVIRSFFALGFFYAIKLHEAEIYSIQQQKQNQHMLLLISNLYEESIQLKKSLKDSEEITRNCYDLYQNLLNDQNSFTSEELAKKILGIAGQVHEIKKDNQRIYSGLSEMISAENSTDYMNVEEIGNIIIQTNQKYAQSLGKNIEFVLSINGVFPPLHVYTTLSLVNNLVSNSVESIKISGLINICINKNSTEIEFNIFDTGSGIPKKKAELIFKPGYTTKYDLSGNPSTGIGLTYVKEVVNNLKGQVYIESFPEKNETIFTIKLPIISLSEKG